MSAHTCAHVGSTVMYGQPRPAVAILLPERKRVGARQLVLLCNGSSWQRAAVKLRKGVHLGAPYFCFHRSLFVLCTAHVRPTVAALKQRGKHVRPHHAPPRVASHTNQICI